MSASSPISESTASPLLTRPPGVETVAVSSKSSGGRGSFQDGSDTPGFADLLDLINPLQHIPIVSTIYRAITGDEIGAVPRIVGDLVFGGPTGLISAIANEVVKGDTGKDIGEHVLAFLMPGSDEPATHLAEADASGHPASGYRMAEVNMDDVEMRPFTSEEEAPATPILAEAVRPAAPSALPFQVPQPQIASAPAIKEASAAPITLAALSSPPLQAQPIQAQPVQNQPAALLQTAQAPVPSIVSGGQFVPWTPGHLAQKAPETPLDAVPPASALPLDDNRFQPKRPKMGEGGGQSHGKLFASAAPHLIPRNDSDMVRRAMTAQGLSAQDHPMIKAADPTGADGAWMMRTMGQALDRYRESAKLGNASDKL